MLIYILLFMYCILFYVFLLICVLTDLINSNFLEGSMRFGRTSLLLQYFCVCIAMYICTSCPQQMAFECFFK